MRSVLLATHIIAGIAGLLLGPATLRAALANRRRTAPSRSYLFAVTVVATTAAGLVALRPAELWPFLLLAVGTEAAVLAAGHARRIEHHVRLVGGSYISLVTALLVVSWGSIAAWILPTVIGTLLVERAAGRYPPATTASNTFS